jgi:16S rRNA (guanine1516-N2)-methyltransferase
LPLYRAQPQGFSFALALTENCLEMRTLGRNQPGPVRADLCSADLRRRLHGGRRQPLARACGLHRDPHLRVLDATAGLGRDGLVLAGLGCTVTLLERSPLVAALLQDGLARAGHDPLIGGWLRQRVRFCPVDAFEYFRTRPEPPHDVVYLDPMYPDNDRRALPKKEMQTLRLLAGDDADADQLLAAALAYAQRRVVVKRPPGSPALGGITPDHRLAGNRARYDVYFTGKNPA